MDPFHLFKYSGYILGGHYTGGHVISYADKIAV